MCRKSRSKVCGLNLFLVFCCFSIQETWWENKLRDTLCNDKVIKILKKEGETRTAPPFSQIGANQLLTPGEPLIFQHSCNKAALSILLLLLFNSFIVIKMKEFLMVKISFKSPVLNNFSYLLFIVKIFLSFAIVIELDVVGEKNLL